MIDKIRKSLTGYDAVAIILILLGVLLRLRQFLTGRSLWVDEAMLALNIVNRSVAELFKPLEYDQGAPLGFLVVEKVFNLLFGRSEFALRLFPFLIGIASIGLFTLLLKRLRFHNAALLAALALFVFNPRLVYYSSEVKQYILDVFVTLVLFLLTVPLLEEEAQKKDHGILAAAGFLALWFSHPALFVLAGIGLTLFIVDLQKRDFKSLRYVLGMGLLWVSTIGFLYVLVLQDLQKNAYMKEYWQGGFLPVPLWSNPGWFARILNENIGAQFGIPYAVYLVFGLMLLGWIALWLQNRRYAIVTASIVLFTLIASGLQLYPVLERMILFTIPIGVLLIGASMNFLYKKLPAQYSLNIGLTVLLAGCLLYGPVTTSVGYFLNPKYYEHIRPAMANLRDTWREGDVLYVTNGAVPAFEFYAPSYGLDEIDYRSNSRQEYMNPPVLLETVGSLKGQRRVWILMSHVYEKDGFNEKEYILDYLKQNGTRKREFRMPGTSVFLYLYDLGK